MTQDLIQELREKPRPKVRDLVQTLGCVCDAVFSPDVWLIFGSICGRYSRYEVSRLLHRAAKKQREAIKEGAQPLYLLEGVNFQDVQVCASSSEEPGNWFLTHSFVESWEVRRGW